MKFLIIDKSSKVVLSTMIDMSVPLYWTSQSYLESYCKDNKKDVPSVEVHEIDDLEITDIYPEKYIFNANTRTFALNSAYIQPSPPPRIWNSSVVRQHLSLAEKSKWDSETSDSIKTAKIELMEGLQVVEMTNLLQFLVDSGDISQASMNKVLA